MLVTAALIANDPDMPQDLLSIIHGMAVAAGQRGKSDDNAFSMHIECPVFGSPRNEDLLFSN